MLPLTTKEVEVHLPAVLAWLATQYMLAKKRTLKNIAKAGEFETSVEMLADTTVPAHYEDGIVLSRTADGLYGACRGGHARLAVFLLKHGASTSSWALQGACRSGHLALAHIMIANGAPGWSWALEGACSGGNIALVRLMIAKGADCWDWALQKACAKGHVEIVKLLIDKGANNLDDGLEIASANARFGVAALLRAHISQK